MRVFCLLLIFIVTSPASADIFSAAGRIEDETARRICSASMIAPDVIVTAAHCVGEGPDRQYYFRPGIGIDVKRVPLEHVVSHPLFHEFKDQRIRHLRFDIALARLAKPLDEAGIEPFSLGDVAVHGENLFVVSWPYGSGPRPRQRRCFVVDGRVPGVVTLGCRVRGGESGAPVVRFQDGKVELVAVVNSTAEVDDRSVALAADVRLRVLPLLDRLPDRP